LERRNFIRIAQKFYMNLFIFIDKTHKQKKNSHVPNRSYSLYISPGFEERKESAKL
jgi:hypothetical protein